VGLGLEGGLLDSCGCWVKWWYESIAFERLMIDIYNESSAYADKMREETRSA